MKPKPVQVLYIGGAGRSGSTLLEMILGNVPGFFSVGEIRYFWEYFVAGDIVCGCGNRLNDCTFWDAVKKQLTSQGQVDFDRMAVLSRRLNRTRNLPRIGKKGLLFGDSDGWEELAASTSELYSIIAQLASANAVVDTSKVPSHSFLLTKAHDIDLHVLHLVRDGRAVAYSWSKRQKQELGIADDKSYMARRSMLRSIVTWLAENAFMLKLRQVVPYTIMRYEDFVENPYKELKQKLSTLDFEDIDLNFLNESEMSLEPTHSVGGNPHRFSQDPISIVADSEWREKMPTMTRLFLYIVALPGLVRFGYKV